MKSLGSLPDLSSWVELREDRPPRILNLLFWVSVASTGLTYGFAFLTEWEQLLRTDPSIVTLAAVSVVFLVLAAALWPFLAWSPSASWPRKAASVLFLLVSLFTIATSNYTVFIIVCVATMNAIAVFGVPGGVLYALFLGGAGTLAATLLPGDPFFIVLVMVGSTVLLVLISGLVYIALLVAAQRAERTRELLSELEEAHAELRRHADRVRELTVAEERARMSREMHDSTGHYLTALTMSLSNALRFRTARPDAAWDEVDQARELAREALTDTRRWVRALRPLQLEGRAGTAAMRAMAESFDGGGVHIDFTDTGTWPELSQEAELVCYRALQEGLTNALRHSGGDRVEVAVAASPEGVSVSVADNGNGAVEETVRSGFGLRGLRERVSALAGFVTSGNLPEGGFRLRVTVPAASADPGRPATVTAGGVA